MLCLISGGPRARDRRVLQVTSHELHQLPPSPGQRHCRTRHDQQEVGTLEIVPGETVSLLYDAVFDVAKGKRWPCAGAGPEGVIGGQVTIASYPVISLIDFDPAAGAARLAFYDFAGQTNAQAQAYLDEHWQADQAELATMDFRPLAVQNLDVAAFAERTRALLAQAADDGEELRPRVEELLGQLATAQAQAEAGDWQAEASLAALLRDSEELLWKLRIFALLNG